jgi:hypothetical protein
MYCEEFIQAPNSVRRSHTAMNSALLLLAPGSHDRCAPRQTGLPEVPVLDRSSTGFLAIDRDTIAEPLSTSQAAIGVMAARYRSTKLSASDEIRRVAATRECSDATLVSRLLELFALFPENRALCAGKLSRS